MPAEFGHPGRGPVVGSGGMVASSHPAVSLLRRPRPRGRRDAADAALAMAALSWLALPGQCGSGGSAFVLLRRPDGSVAAFGGSGFGPDGGEPAFYRERGFPPSRWRAPSPSPRPARSPPSPRCTPTPRPAACPNCGRPRSPPPRTACPAPRRRAPTSSSAATRSSATPARPRSSCRTAACPAPAEPIFQRALGASPAAWPTTRATSTRAASPNAAWTRSSKPGHRSPATNGWRAAAQPRSPP